MPDEKPNKLQTLWEELDRPLDAHNPENSAKRLKERAQQYATPPKNNELEASTYFSLLSFDLGRERYGLDVHHVRGLRTLERITRVPGVPEFYRGVVNVRGRVLSVLDLQRFFQRGNPNETLYSSELILIEAQGLYLALLADHIVDIQLVPEVALEPIDMPYARGMFFRTRTIVFDMDALFADERLLVGRGN